jgi:hypothetical protein
MIVYTILTSDTESFNSPDAWAREGTPTQRIPYETLLTAHSGLDDGMEAVRILLMRPMPSHEWMEKCFVAFVLLMSRRPDTGWDGMAGLRDVVDNLEKRGFPDFSTSAAHAVVIVRQSPIILTENRSTELIGCV